MPLSICASVPKNTSTSDSANSVTVIRSDPSTSRTCTSGCFLRPFGSVGAAPSASGAGFTADASTMAVDAGAAAGVFKVSLIGGSGELDGLDERLELGAVRADGVGVAEQLEEPGLLAALDQHQQRPLLERPRGADQ